MKNGTEHPITINIDHSGVRFCDKITEFSISEINSWIPYFWAVWSALLCYRSNKISTLTFREKKTFVYTFQRILSMIILLIILSINYGKYQSQCVSVVSLLFILKWCCDMESHFYNAYTSIAVDFRWLIFECFSSSFCFGFICNSRQIPYY